MTADLSRAQRATLMPGLTTGDITLGSRARGLQRARDLLDEMLGEITG